MRVLRRNRPAQEGQARGLKHKTGLVILEDIIIGVCDLCGTRYYSADILQAVDDIATGTRPFDKTEEIPVAHLSQA